MKQKPQIKLLNFSRTLDDKKLSDEDRAINQLFTHQARVILYDEANPKALKRAGKIGESVRELLLAIDIYRYTRQGGKFEIVGEKK